MLLNLSHWSPNFLSAMPYHLQLKQIILRAIADGRCPVHSVLPEPKVIGAYSLFQKEYVLMAYELLVEEGLLTYVPESGRYAVAN